jgi:hypothetical protein
MGGFGIIRRRQSKLITNFPVVLTNLGIFFIFVFLTLYEHSGVGL